MSEAAVLEAPAAAPAPATPSAPSLLGIAPSAPATPAASAPAPAAPVAPANDPSAPALPTPYFAKLVADNPDLKAYEATLGRFHEPTTAEEYVKVLGKSYGELSKFKGALVPGDDAKPEDVANYRKINGIPSEAAGYKLGESLGEQFKSLGITDPALIGKYEASAHKHNLTPAQFAGVMADHGAIVQELQGGAETQSAKAHEQSVAALRSEWGANFDANLGDAQKLHEIAFAGAKLTDQEAKDMAEFVKTPAYAKLLNSLGQRIPKESTIHNGQNSPFQGAASKLKQMTDAMRDNPKHPALDHTHPDHSTAFEALVKLQAEANGH